MLDGELGVIVDGKKRTLTSADGRVSIPAGARHTYWPIEGPVDPKFEGLQR